MIGFVKLAAVSAALSYSAVTAYNLPVQKLEAAVAGKYQDRIPTSEELASFAVSSAPEGAVRMAGATGGAGKGDRLTTRSEMQVGHSTVEYRESANTSVLARVSSISMAQR